MDPLRPKFIYAMLSVWTFQYLDRHVADRIRLLLSFESEAYSRGTGITTMFVVFSYFVVAWPDPQPGDSIGVESSLAK